jgi:CheY-like chemotaxis protein
MTADERGNSINCQAILVVEDEVLIRLALADSLRTAGYSVIEAANGGDALSWLRSGQDCDLVITDVNMPGPVDGIALAKCAKRLSAGLPVIVTSGHLAREASHPADAFLPKPYSDTALIDTVFELIGPPCRDRNQALSGWHSQTKIADAAAPINRSNEQAC